MSYKVISQKGYSTRDFISLEDAQAEATRMTRRTGILFCKIKNGMTI